jgi:hypothetical protein
MSGTAWTSSGIGEVLIRLHTPGPDER